MSPQTSNMRIYLLSAAVLLVTFILGAFTGAGLMTTYSPDPMKAPPPRHHGGEKGMRDGDGPMFHPLPLSDLKLSTDQEDKILSILEKNRPQLDAIFEDTFPKLQAATAKMDKKIREVLNDEQKVKFDQMLEEREKRMKDGKPPMPKRRPQEK